MIDRRSRLRGVLIGPSIDTSNYRCAPRWLITTGWPRLLTKPRSMPVLRLFSLIRLDRVIILPTTRVPLSFSSSSSYFSFARFSRSTKRKRYEGNVEWKGISIPGFGEIVKIVFFFLRFYLFFVQMIMIFLILVGILKKISFFFSFRFS